MDRRGYGGPLEDTLKKIDTLRKRVSNDHDGCEGRTISRTMFHRMCLIRWWTLEENE